MKNHVNTRMINPFFMSLKMGWRDFDGILSPKKLGVSKMRMLIFQAPVSGFYELHTLMLKLALRVGDEFPDR